MNTYTHSSYSSYSPASSRRDSLQSFTDSGQSGGNSPNYHHALPHHRRVSEQGVDLSAMDTLQTTSSTATCPRLNSWMPYTVPGAEYQVAQSALQLTDMEQLYLGHSSSAEGSQASDYSPTLQDLHAWSPAGSTPTDPDFPSLHGGGHHHSSSSSSLHNMHTSNSSSGSSSRRKSHSPEEGGSPSPFSSYSEGATGGMHNSVHGIQVLRRREQNRASQRAFRARKEKYTRDLENDYKALQVRYNDLVQLLHQTTPSSSSASSVNGAADFVKEEDLGGYVPSDSEMAALYAGVGGVGRFDGC